MKKVLLSEPRESIMTVLMDNEPSFVSNEMKEGTLLTKLPIMGKNAAAMWYEIVREGMFISPDILINTNIDQSHYESLKLLVEHNLVTRLMLTEYIKNT